MSKNFFSLIIFLLFVQIVFCQIKETKVFRLLDIETKEPIAFATVMLKNKNRGTHADTEGYFEIPTQYISTYSIKISSIGYVSKEVDFSKLELKSITVIYLKPANTVLKEIVIKSKKKKKKRILAYSIIRKAIDNIPKNYPIKPYSYIGYYRDYQQPINDGYKKFINAKDNIDYLNLHEGIIEVFDAGFSTNQLTNEKNQTLIYDFKTNNNFKIDTTLTIPYDNYSRKFSDNYNITPLGGNELNLLNLANTIRNYNRMSFSFANIFKRDFSENHNFKVKSQKYLEDEILYEIHFESKKSKMRDKYFASGKIFIDKSNFAIHKLQYDLFYRSINNLQYSITSEFSKKDSKMYLNYITFNNKFIANSSNYFKVEKAILDINSFAFKVVFNKEFNPETLLPFKRKFRATYKNKFLKVSKIVQLNNKTVLVYLDTSQVHILDNKNEESFTTDFGFDVRNVEDINGYKINKKIGLKFNQYRELFVQEVFTEKEIPKNKFFVKKMQPLSKSKIETIQLEDNYWINSPLKKAKKE